MIADRRDRPGRINREIEMPPQDAARNDEFSWANPQLKAQLLADPVAVLRDRGLTVPPDVPKPVIHEFARVLFLLWVDGKVVPLDQFYIDPGDEGLLFGRGAWESTRTVNGTPWLWPAHVERLWSTAQVLGIEVAAERLPDVQQVQKFVRSLTGQDVVVRLNVSAGRPTKPGMVWMSAAPQPVAPASIRLKTIRNPVQKGQAYLTLKTFQYATRLRLAAQAAQAGFDTALLTDADGNLLEASHANLFVRLEDGWATPAADGGLLPGTVRQVMLEKSPLPIREQVIPASLVPKVREAFVTNSNVGIVPVTQIDQLTLAIGPETRSLIQWLEPPPPAGTQYRFVERRGVSR
jgi:branched-subunit amino acid aminotransferase/4-amino-4-deoxychorismate lyase